MFLVDSIFSCWPLNRTQYDSLNKKDDDFGVEEVYAWKNLYPIDPDLSKLSTEKIKEYAKNIIKDLNALPITSSNIELVKEHLIEMSKQSDRMRCQLLERGSDIKTDKNSILYIQNGLIFTYTNKR
ncbi:MAG: hypothetical protein ACXU9U_03065 [Parachlamydiaceae bacterium]